MATVPESIALDTVFHSKRMSPPKGELAPRWPGHLSPVTPKLRVGALSGQGSQVPLPKFRPLPLPRGGAVTCLTRGQESASCGPLITSEHRRKRNPQGGVSPWGPAPGGPQVVSEDPQWVHSSRQDVRSVRVGTCSCPGHCWCPRAGPGGRSAVLARGMNETSGGHHVSGEDKHNDSGDCTQRVCQGTLADSTPGGPRGLWRVRVI